MIFLKELIDNNTPYSTTRWAFIVCVRAGIVLAFLTLIMAIVLLILGKSVDGLLGGSVALIGVILGIPTTAKALQGFETNRKQEENDNKEETIA